MINVPSIFMVFAGNIRALLILSLIFGFESIYPQVSPHALQNQPSQKIEIQETFNRSAQINPFVSSNPVGGLVISADIDLHSDTSLVRVILRDVNNNEYLVYEVYPLLADNASFSVTEKGEETASLNNITPAGLEIQIVDASFHLTNIVTSRADGFTPQARADFLKSQASARINEINQNLRKKNLPWVAGETSFSHMTYQQKKAYFGGTLPNLNGIEYYAGGVYVMPGSLDDQSLNDNFHGLTSGAEGSPYVKEFDWRNRHGQNWVTPVKDQGYCGSCWAFGPVGATELMVNLYYNRHIDMDLSEQEVVSCSGGGSCSGGWPDLAMNYLATDGVTDEPCFSYEALDLACAVKCTNPSEKVKIGGYSPMGEGSDEALKKMVLGGPVSIALLSWRHVITLVGYKTLNAGDTIYSFNGDEVNWWTITNDSPFNGRTVWIIKNSWGTDWGENGYAYYFTDISFFDPYQTFQLTGKVMSKGYTDADIACVDQDGDGYYTWGMGPKPAYCPPSPDEPDGDDSNPCFGPMDEYGNLQSSASPQLQAEDVTIFEGQVVPELTVDGSNVKWYDDNQLTHLLHSGATFATGQSTKGVYPYYVTQTLNGCESPPETVLLTILKGMVVPEVTADTVCENERGVLYAVGDNIRWYDDEVHTTLLQEGDSYAPEKDTPGTYTFYVTQTFGGIESGSAEAVYVVKASPQPVYAYDKVFCKEDGLYMNAIGSGIKWQMDVIPDSLFDVRNGKVYKTVTIGNQVWMAENLDIGYRIDASAEQSDNGVIEKYYYREDTLLGKQFGGLYQYPEVMNYSTGEGQQGICPEGWHVPSHNEYRELEMALGMSQEEAGKIGLHGTTEGSFLKEGGSSGFKALMAGKWNSDGYYDNQGYYGTFWTSDAYTRTLSVFFDQVYTGYNDESTNAFSVRCVMNDSAYIKYGGKLDLDNFTPGDYDFLVTNTVDGCESLPDTVHLTLHEKPQPPAVTDNEICQDNDLPLLYAAGENVKWYMDTVPAFFTDSRNNKVYNTVRVGNQVWMGKNLDIGSRVNGSVNQSDNGIIEKYYYNNDAGLGQIYGGLYQWNELMNYSDEEGHQGICPDGWRIPSHKDWMLLETALGMNQADATVFGWRGTNQGTQIKEGGSSGFEALMAGKRDEQGGFASAYNYTTFWNADGYTRTLQNGIQYPKIWSSRSDAFTNGLSVRCIMNDSAYTVTGNQFVVPHSEPGTYSYSVTQTVDGCESDQAKVILNLKETPDPPQVSDVSVCAGEGVPDLIATGENVKWYLDRELTRMVHTGGQFSTSESLPGQYTWYVTQTHSDCESYPTEVSLIIKSVPSAPVVSDTTGCEGGRIPGLFAAGENIRWYSDEALTNLIHSGNLLSTGETMAGSYPYFVTREIDGCNSAAATASLHILPVPAAPLTDNVTVCEGDSMPSLLGSGQEISWYEDAGLQNLVSTGEWFNTGKESAGTYTWYATQTVSGCESSGSPAGLTIKPTPDSPVTSDTAICENEAVPLLWVHGENIMWYDTPDLSDPVQNGEYFNPGNPGPGVHAYYVTQTHDECESSPSTVVLTVNVIPSAPVAEDISSCEGSPVPVLQASGRHLKWYGDAALTLPLDTGNILVSNHTEAGIYTYFVTREENGCVSPAAQVDLSILATPVAPGAEAVSVCAGEMIPVLTASGENIQWYADPGMTSLLFSGNVFISGITDPGSYTFYVTQTIEKCESNPRTVVLTVHEKPDVDLGPDTSITQEDTLVLGPYPDRYTYFWNDGSDKSYFIIYGEDYPAGMHLFSVTVTNTDCSIQDSLHVYVGDPIGISQSFRGWVSIYPNPTNGLVTIRFENDFTGNGMIEVLNSTGMIIRKYTRSEMEGLQHRQVEFYLDEKGLYFIRITLNGRVLMGKVVRL